MWLCRYRGRISKQPTLTLWLCRYCSRILINQNLLPGCADTVVVGLQVADSWSVKIDLPYCTVQGSLTAPIWCSGQLAADQWPWEVANRAPHRWSCRRVIASRALPVNSNNTITTDKLLLLRLRPGSSFILLSLKGQINEVFDLQFFFFIIRTYTEPGPLTIGFNNSIFV